MARSTLAAVLVWLALCPAGWADDTAAWDALRDGRAVLLLRHATAPGVGDPSTFRLEDCATQRNLDEQGREESRRWGALLRQQRIDTPRIFTSRWCRARETGQAMALGAVLTMPALDSFFDNRVRAAEQTGALVEQVNGMGPGAPLVLVSHQVNISALTGLHTRSGEGLILALPLSVPARALARIPVPD